MSAFVVVFERSNTPVGSGVLDRVMGRLKHRGPDGKDVWLAGNVAMGHWHFWTTPEEAGESQPLKIASLPFRIVFDGRLDNRKELIRKLRLNSGEETGSSDAVLVLHGYEKWGNQCVEHFIGEFAFVILDEPRTKLFCARDALGDRSLFYTIRGTQVLIASEPWALTGPSPELNENTVAHYFSVRATENGETLFKNIFELSPAHAIIFSTSGEQSWRYWQPNLNIVPQKSDQEYAEEFRTLLEESVSCRLRSNDPVAVMMSGGLDSTSVASLASQTIVPHPLTTISYVFDEFPECDERHYIETVKAKHGIHSIQIPCDDLLPYQNLQNHPHNPNRPDGNIYRSVIERIYRHAAQKGVRVLLTGTYGDELYCGAENWLADLITAGRLGDAVQDIKLHVRYSGVRATLTSAYVRKAVIQLLDHLPGGRGLVGFLRRWRETSSQTENPLTWLTPFSLSFITSIGQSKEQMLGMLTAQDCVTEAFYASRYNLELRYPYRDRRLIEYVLSLPAHQLYRHGKYKHVLRTAMQGILPELVRTRTKPTTLLTLLARGMEQNGEAWQAYVHASQANWHRYVRADWLERHWNVPVTVENDGVWAVIPWLCTSYTVWQSTILDSGGDHVQ